MGSYAYDKNTGTLTTLATSGQRTWVGTKAQHDAARTAGTLPNNAIIAITDDEVDHNHYSTEETETGMYWIDGKPIYRKVIDIGSLPDTPSQKTINHGIDNLDTVITVRGFTKRSNGTNLMLPNVGANLTDGTGVFATSTAVVVTVNNPRSAYSGYVLIEYTKTTD